MNEVLFNQIAKDDLDNLNKVISKNNFETSEFEEAISKLSTTLGFLAQAMGV